MSRQLGFWSVFALVTGSQIGTGVFMLPASLAPFGWLSLTGWIISGLGAMTLALVFAHLCSRFPRTGGPHVYVYETFGRDAAFFTGWTYWLISWVSSTAVITASIGYVTPLLGPISSNTHLALEIGLLALITLINLKGVSTAGRAEFFLSLLKIIPLLIVPCVALFFFNKAHFIPLSETGGASTMSLLKATALLTLWGFIGVESATAPAGSVKNPSKTIPRAVILGTGCVALLYFFNSLGVMGAIPNTILLTSNAPYADVARVMFGGNWHLVISLIAAIVCIGTLNAWTLTSGQIALGIAQDKLLPPVFAKTNQQGAPYMALLISAFGTVPLLILTQHDTLAGKIELIIDFSVTAFLFVYVMSCLAALKLLVKEKNRSVFAWLKTLIALSFCLWVISASSLATLLTATTFVVSGVPIWIYLKLQRKDRERQRAEHSQLTA